MMVRQQQAQGHPRRPADGALKVLVEDAVNVLGQLREVPENLLRVQHERPVEALADAVDCCNDASVNLEEKNKAGFSSFAKGARSKRYGIEPLTSQDAGHEPGRPRVQGHVQGIK